MKRGLIFAAAFGLCASLSAQGIVGSVHDFSGNAWARNQICLPCHSPHDNNRDPAIGGHGILWNHDSTTTTFTMYTSFAFTYKGIAAGPVPNSPSLTCLSCHDGTVALDAYSGAPGGGPNWINPGARVPGSSYWDNPAFGQGTQASLQNTHPISVIYDETNPASELNPKSAPIGAYTIGQVLYRGDYVECSSCHDIHNTNTQDVMLLRAPISGSQLCLACHAK